MKTLKCEMTKECPHRAMYLDERGFIYCKQHGLTRKRVMRCIVMTPKEIKTILENKQIEKYEAVS